MVMMEMVDFLAKLTIAFILIRAGEIFTRGSWFAADLGAIFGGGVITTQVG